MEPRHKMPRLDRARHRAHFVDYSPRWAGRCIVRIWLARRAECL